MSCVERMRTFLDNVDLPHYAEKKARVKGSHTNMSFILIRWQFRRCCIYVYIHDNTSTKAYVCLWAFAKDEREKCMNIRSKAKQKKSETNRNHKIAANHNNNNDSSVADRCYSALTTIFTLLSELSQYIHCRLIQIAKMETNRIF